MKPFRQDLQTGSPELLIRTLAVGYPSGAVLERHSHAWAQLVYAFEGVMTVQTGQGTWVVPAQRAVWIPGGVEHSVAMSGWVSMRTLYLTPSLVRALPDRCCVVAVAPLLRELILHAVARGPLRGDLAEHRHLIDCLLDQLGELPAAPLELPVPRDDRALRVALRLREEPGIAEPVDALARAAGASRRTLERLPEGDGHVARALATAGATPRSHAPARPGRARDVHRPRGRLREPERLRRGFQERARHHAGALLPGARGSREGALSREAEAASRGMQVTPYADANRLLESLLVRIRGILGEKLVGMYLYGSLATGDFDPGISDVDLLAALSSGLADSEFESLRAMHRELERDEPEWVDRIEVAYVSLRALRTFRSERSPVAVISPGEPFHGTEAGSDWLANWYAVREEGRDLFGPPAATLIAPISRDEFERCIRGYAADWGDRIHGVRERKEQAFAILTMCRALHLHSRGERASKRESARWAQEELPQWSGLIRSALAWRRAWREEAVDHDSTLTETMRFVRFARDRILAREPSRR